MKRIFCFLSLLSGSICAQEKKFMVKMGATYELPRKADNLAFFGNEKDGIVNLSIKDNELNILRFNPRTLALAGEHVIEIPDATRNMVSEIVINHGNDYYWLRSDFQKSGKKDLLYSQKIDVVKGNTVGERLLMIESEKLDGYKVRKTGFSPKWKVDYKYQFNFSANRELVLVSCKSDPEKQNDKKNIGNIGLHVFDNKMKKLWGNEFKMPYTDFAMDERDFSIDSKGNAYLLAKVYDTKDRKEELKDKTPGYHFEIMQFQNGNPDPIIVKLNPENQFIKNVAILEMNANEMLIVCTYASKFWGVGVEGLYLAVLTGDGKITRYKEGFYEFPDNELKKYVSKAELKNMEKEGKYTAPPLTIHDIIIGADGGIFITCEQIGASITGSGNSITYMFEDIFAAKISPLGSLEWLRRIPKKQGSFHPTGIGFKTVFDSSGYSILYIDNEVNLQLKDDEQPKLHLDGVGGVLLAAKITNSGELTKEVLLNTRDEKLMVHPPQFDRINKNQFIGRTVLKENDTYQLMLISSK